MRMIKRLPFGGTVMGISDDEIRHDTQKQIFEEIDLIILERRAKIRRFKGLF